MIQENEIVHFPLIWIALYLLYVLYVEHTLLWKGICITRRNGYKSKFFLIFFNITFLYFYWSFIMKITLRTPYVIFTKAYEFTLAFAFIYSCNNEIKVSWSKITCDSGLISKNIYISIIRKALTEEHLILQINQHSNKYPQSVSKTNSI